MKFKLPKIKEIRIKRTVMFMLHWRVGLIAAFFVLWLSITGILLNHSRALGLHHIFLDNSFILKLYNMDVAEDLRGQGINLEKLILDMHTGKLFGLPGTLLSDLAALALIFLTLSGLYSLWRRKKND